MKKTILLSIIGLGTLAFGIGCTTVESKPAPVTHSTTTSSREVSVAPSASTTTRTTAVQAY